MEFLRNSTPAKRRGRKKEEKSRSEEIPPGRTYVLAVGQHVRRRLAGGIALGRCPPGNTRARCKGLPSGRLKNRGGLAALPYFRG
jgi:hypothetical protein